MLDLHFSHPHVEETFLPPNVSLRFLDIVEVASVPLYLAAEASLDVWTSDKTTQQWLHDCLIEELSDGEIDSLGSWWEKPGRQSRHGILLGVRGGHHEGFGTDLCITEVLLYAAASTSQQHTNVPPSPPASFSPRHKGSTDDGDLNLRLFALPLSSKIFQTIQQLPDLQQSYAQLSDEGYYLPTPPDGSFSALDGHAPKRAKIESIFQNATYNRRQQKKRGGEGIAKAMAGTEHSFSTPPLPSPTLPKPVQSRGKQPSVLLKRGPLSRALTTGSLRSTAPATYLSEGSRRTSLINDQRSSLHRVESALSPSIDGTNSPVPEDSTNNDFVTQNKTALSRIIMTGMRMHGFQPQRKKSISIIAKSQSQAAPLLDASSTTVGGGQEDYKAVYHQTFKATSFVFRKHWANRAMGQDMLRDTVDGLLGQFCQDPFADHALDASFDGGKPPSSQKY